jgi:hypothetical protein
MSLIQGASRRHGGKDEGPRELMWRLSARHGGDSGVGEFRLKPTTQPLVRRARETNGRLARERFGSWL